MSASQKGHVIVLERLLQHRARVDLQTQVYYIMYRIIMQISCKSSYACNLVHVHKPIYTVWM